MKIQPKDFNINAAAQCARLKEYLEQNSEGITVAEAKEKLEIYHAPARVHELRYLHNLNILTHWIYETSSRGVKHRIGNYILMAGRWKKGKNND